MNKFPYQVLMQNNNLTESDLPKDVLELVRTIKKKVTFANNKGDDSESTTDSINAFDKYICTGIYNFLEEKEEDEKEKRDKILREEEERVDNERLEADRIKKEKEELENPTPPTPPAEKKGRVGFFGF